MKYRADIQGLRAVAVILVFIFHLIPSAMSGGFIGVDVFFVISGYLISGIILHKKERHTFSFLEFYISRCKRIVPLYYIVLIAVLVGGALIYIPTDIPQLISGVYWSALFLSNHYLAGLDTYFGASSIENPLLHTWTLSIEMQFYFLLPLLLVFLPQKRLFPVLLLFTVLLLFYSFYSSAYLGEKDSMYFSLAARIPEFFIGALFAIYPSPVRHLRGWASEVISTVCLLILLASAFFLSAAANFPGLWVLMPCLATAFLLANKDSVVNKVVLSNRVLVHLGELSYAIYLIHWPIMAYVRYHFDKVDFSLIEMALIVLATYLLSLLAYNTAEGYFRKLKLKWFVFGFGAIALALVIIVLVLPKEMQNRGIPDVYAKPTFGMDSHGSTFTKVGYYGDVSIPNDSILLLGDSHARVYASILNDIGKKNNFNFHVISNSTYPLIPGISKADSTEGENYEVYLSLLEYTKREIAKAKVIVIASLWYEPITSLPQALDTFLAGLDTSKTVIVLQDYPILDSNPIRENKDFVKRSEAENDYNVIEKEIPDEIMTVLKDYPNAHVLDFNYLKYFDDLPFYKDTLMYYDEGHLNAYGTAKVAEKVEKEFMRQFADFIF